MKYIIAIIAVLFVCNSAMCAEIAPVTFSASNISAVPALEAVMRAAEVNFIIDNDVNGNINIINITDIPFDQAIKAICNASDQKLVIKQNSGIYRISVAPVVKEQTAITTDEIAVTEKSEIKTIKKIKLYNITPSYLLNILKGEQSNAANFDSKKLTK